MLEDARLGKLEPLLHLVLTEIGTMMAIHHEGAPACADGGACPWSTAPARPPSDLR